MSLVKSLETTARKIAADVTGMFDRAAKDDKKVSAAMMAGAVVGVVVGLSLSSAFWPVAFAGAVAGSYTLAVANRDGSPLTRVLAAMIGFPLGAMFAGPVVGCLLGARLGQHVALSLEATPAGAQAPAAAKDGEASANALGQKLKPGFDASATPAPAAKADPAAPAKAPDAPKP